jgi:hypothetical protein
MSVTGRPISKAWFARLKNGEIKTLFPFQFNPSSLDRTRDVGYAFITPPGSILPTAVFLGIAGDTISLNMLLDATSGYSDSKEGVNAQKAELESYTQPDIESYINTLGQFIPPPEVRFGYGADSFKVIITKLKFHDSRFNIDGYPTRTTAEMEMRTYYTSQAEIRQRLARLEALRSQVIIQEVT